MQNYFHRCAKVFEASTARHEKDYSLVQTSKICRTRPTSILTSQYRDSGRPSRMKKMETEASWRKAINTVCG